MESILLFLLGGTVFLTITIMVSLIPQTIGLPSPGPALPRTPYPTHAKRGKTHKMVLWLKTDLGTQNSCFGWILPGRKIRFYPQNPKIPQKQIPNSWGLRLHTAQLRSAHSSCTGRKLTIAHVLAIQNAKIYVFWGIAKSDKWQKHDFGV